MTDSIEFTGHNERTGTRLLSRGISYGPEQHDILSGCALVHSLWPVMGRAISPLSTSTVDGPSAELHHPW